MRRKEKEEEKSKRWREGRLLEIRAQFHRYNRIGNIGWNKRINNKELASNMLHFHNRCAAVIITNTVRNSDRHSLLTIPINTANRLCVKYTSPGFIRIAICWQQNRILFLMSRSIWYFGLSNALVVENKPGRNYKHTANRHTNTPIIEHHLALLHQRLYT